MLRRFRPDVSSKAVVDRAKSMTDTRMLRRIRAKMLMNDVPFLLNEGLSEEPKDEKGVGGRVHIIEEE